MVVDEFASVRTDEYGQSHISKMALRFCLCHSEIAYELRANGLQGAHKRSANANGAVWQTVGKNSRQYIRRINCKRPRAATRQMRRKPRLQKGGKGGQIRATLHNTFLAKSRRIIATRQGDCLPYGSCSSASCADCMTRPLSTLMGMTVARQRVVLYNVQQCVGLLPDSSHSAHCLLDKAREGELVGQPCVWERLLRSLA